MGYGEFKEKILPSRFFGTSTLKRFAALSSFTETNQVVSIRSKG